MMLHLGLRGTHDPVGGKGERGLGQVVARGAARREHGAVEHDECDLVGAAWGTALVLTQRRKSLESTWHSMQL